MPSSFGYLKKRGQTNVLILSGFSYLTTLIVH
jgi:hypothetical protein